MIKKGLSGRTHLKNILLMKRSLFTGFLFFPFGTSVHIFKRGMLGQLEFNSSRQNANLFYVLQHLAFLPVSTQVIVRRVGYLTILLCLSKAFTRANSFLLFRSEIRICVWFRTACCSTERGPCEISNSSSWRSCASSSSDFGTCANWLRSVWVSTAAIA